MSLASATDTIVSMLKVSQKRLKQLARQHGLDLVVLFGSQASGRAHTGSDVDVAVRIKPGRTLSADARLALAGDFDSVFPDAALVDVSFLNEAGSLLLYEVATRGRPLYERAPLSFWQFQSYAARRYDDDYKYRLRREAYLERRVKEWDHKRKPSSSKN